ncbi:MAG: response regulator [Gammaproteobacteria bacterium]|nr:response regulator [Gammaproteobacteria bacterium]
MDFKDYFTPNEVAQLFMVSPVTVRQWAQKGLLNAALTAGGHRRFLHQELIRFALERGLTLNWPAQGKARILIVDDDALLSACLYEFLEGRPDIEAVDIATHGFQAGRKLHSFRPNLMLLDLTMPGMDGFAVCNDLKTDPSTHNIRVLAMTDYPDTDNLDRILRAGAEVCLEKPVDTNRLLELLHPEPRQGLSHAHS